MAGPSSSSASWKAGPVGGTGPAPEPRGVPRTEQFGEDGTLSVGTDVADDEAAFTALGRESCLSLLGTRGIGRVAFTMEGDAAPTVLPVNYALLNDTIVFRTKLAGSIMRHARGYASFQVDHLDEERREGWSVLASGRCRRVPDAGELSRIPQGRLPVPWASGDRDQVLKLTPGRMAGRRIRRP